MESFEIQNGEIKVAEIMQTIREKIQKKREEGIYTDEEIEELAGLKLESYVDEAEIDNQLLTRLMGESHNWNIAADYRIQSHRTGIAATLIVFLKKMVRPLVRLYTDHVIGRQAQLNLYFAHLLHNLVRETTRQSIEITTLRNRCDQLEREKGFLEKRQKAFEELAQMKGEEDAAG